ncbi:MAG TPA: HisS family protein, partial [Nitrolancea sp.]|nr:HisS family protein [Nitrolancea sp.]
FARTTATEGLNVYERPGSSGRRLQLERLRGMADVGPASFAMRDAVRKALLERMARYGYRQVDTPLIEPTELFLRKSGGERIAQMYAFRYRERDIALRPEHTASILRMYVDSLQAEPLPLRYSYAGPVFRYEKPQSGRTRQFTEIGCELLGADGPIADAEVMHLALDGLAALGIRGHLVLGHVGLVLDFLDRLPLRQRARDWLIWSMERVRKGRAVDLEQDLPGLVSSDRLSSLFDEMGATLSEVPSDQLESWVLAVLNEVGVETQGGTRTPEEIVAGVIAKMSRHSDQTHVRHAFEFIQELAQIHGSPNDVIPELRSLVRRHHLADEPIDRIERVLELLTAFGHEVEDFELSPGLGRGLHYYTGMLFEIYDGDVNQGQLVGGGRYDDLAQTLGARQPLPACGFTYGLERLVDALAANDQPERDVTLIAPAGADALPAAIQIAEQLRAEGRIVELDVRGRSVSANRRYAERLGMTAMIVVQADGTQATETLRQPALATKEAAGE